MFFFNNSEPGINNTYKISGRSMSLTQMMGGLGAVSVGANICMLIIKMELTNTDIAIAQNMEEFYKQH